MRYICTRGGEKVSSAQAALKCLGKEGGLFVPETIPKISSKELDDMQELDFAGRVAVIVKKYFPEFEGEELLSALECEYSRFSSVDPAPLVSIGDELYVLELFHGPTLSAQDTAIAPLSCLIEKTNGNTNIVTLSTGDIAKALLERFKNHEKIKVLALYPNERLSKMQKLLLGVQEGENLKVLGLKGSFDDCQTALKDALLSNLGEADIVWASSASFACLAPRIAYYYSAYLDLLSSGKIENGELIDFYIPCGNMGVALAGYYAKAMGLPVRKIRCANNENSAVSEFLRIGILDISGELVKTTSPALDILNPLNLERLIFEASGRDISCVEGFYNRLATEKRADVGKAVLDKIRELFDGGAADEETCVEAMYDVFEDTGYTMDMGTGCAMKILHDWYEKNKKDQTKAVLIALSSPFKSPQDVLYAVTGNDVKDSFKGVKRLHEATAMLVPKFLKELRDKPVLFNRSIDKKKLVDEIKEFVK